MSRRWVVHASPLIILGKLSKIELLIKLTEELIVPDAVAQEIDRGEKHDPARQCLAQEGRKHIKETPSPSTVIANWDLGDGESHVLNWACINRDYEAILDDLAARRCAKTLSIPCEVRWGSCCSQRRQDGFRSSIPCSMTWPKQVFTSHPICSRPSDVWLASDVVQS